MTDDMRPGSSAVGVAPSPVENERNVMVRLLTNFTTLALSNGAHMVKISVPPPSMKRELTKPFAAFCSFRTLAPSLARYLVSFYG